MTDSVQGSSICAYCFFQACDGLLHLKQCERGHIHPFQHAILRFPQTQVFRLEPLNFNLSREQCFEFPTLMYGLQCKYMRSALKSHYLRCASKAARIVEIPQRILYTGL